MPLQVQSCYISKKPSPRYHYLEYNMETQIRFTEISPHRWKSDWRPTTFKRSHTNSAASLSSKTETFLEFIEKVALKTMEIMKPFFIKHSALQTKHLQKNNIRKIPYNNGKYSGTSMSVMTDAKMVTWWVSSGIKRYYIQNGRSDLCWQSTRALCYVPAAKRFVRSGFGWSYSSACSRTVSGHCYYERQCEGLQGYRGF